MRIARLGAVAALVVGWTLAPVTPAHAADAAVCTIEIEIDVVPGLSSSPSDQTFTSVPGTGVATCEGTVMGHLITGQGTDSNYGTMTDASCGGGTGEGVDRLVLPTEGGEVVTGAPFTFSFVTGAGQAHSEILEAAFVGHPLQGDCFSAPLTRIGLVIVAVMHAS